MFNLSSNGVLRVFRPKSLLFITNNKLTLSFLENWFKVVTGSKGIPFINSLGLGALLNRAPVTKKLRRRSCQNLSKYFSLSVLFLLSLLVPAKKKKLSLLKNPLWKNLQCLNTNDCLEQGARPALTRQDAALPNPLQASHDVAFHRAHSLENLFTGISPMNLGVASFKLAPNQANRGLPC